MISEITRRAFLASLAASAVPVRLRSLAIAASFGEARRSAFGAKAVKPLPPLSWTCPMHAEVVDNERGKCPICKMDLVPVRLDLVWSCQLHLDSTYSAAGRCRVCNRELVRIIKALSFACPVHPKVNDVNPGTCPIDKRQLVAKYSLRPHGDHNPKHGGQFFMAPNNWHVEVTHPAAGVFRLYVYDEYSRPFVPKGFSSRIVSIPAANGKTSDMSIQFARSAAGPFLVARIPALALPATIAVKARFAAAEPEYRFDFPFFEYSKEPR